MTKVQATEVKEMGKIEESRLFFLQDYFNFWCIIHGRPPVQFPRQKDTERVTVQNLLSKVEPPTPFEYPVMTYTIPSGEIEILRRRWGQYILGKMVTWDKKPESPMTYTDNGTPEYPCKTIMINRHRLIEESKPNGIYLTPLKRPPGSKTLEKTRGKRRVFYEPKDSVLGAFTAFYRAISTELQLIIYEKIPN